MEPGRVLRDLQGRAPIPHRMVRGHAALVLHTQAPGEGRADPRDAGGARLRARLHPRQDPLLSPLIARLEPQWSHLLSHPCPRLRGPP